MGFLFLLMKKMLFDNSAFGYCSNSWKWFQERRHVGCSNDKTYFLEIIDRELPTLLIEMDFFSQIKQKQKQLIWI